jgi:C4-dicarboxylate transporter, DctM subunit
MNPGLVGAAGIGIMCALLFLDVPVWIAMGSVAFVGFGLLCGFPSALKMLGLLPASTISDYTISVFPLFLLMGEFADISGLMKDAYRSANTWLGNLPGGLAMASIVGAGAFSAVSGSSMSCAAIMGRVALPHLLEYKYDKKLSVGALCAGGTLGNLIPPGILIVFYCLITNTSIGALFAACFIPGIVLTLMYCIQIYIQCKRNPVLGPRAGRTTWRQKLLAIKDGAALIIVLGLVMGGIWGGFFTPSEAAAAGTVFVFIYAIFRRAVNGQNLLQSFKNALGTTGMAFAVMVGVRCFNSFIAVTGLNDMLCNWVTGLNVAPILVVIIMMIIYSVLGGPMDTLSMMLFTVPIFVGMLAALKVNLIWFGVLVIIQMEFANITPPVGLNLFVIGGMAKDKGISMETVFRGVVPFCLTMLAFNALIVAFPQIAMWLPNLIKW